MYSRKTINRKCQNHDKTSMAFNGQSHPRTAHRQQKDNQQIKRTQSPHHPKAIQNTTIRQYTEIIGKAIEILQITLRQINTKYGSPRIRSIDKLQTTIRERGKEGEQREATAVFSSSLLPTVGPWAAAQLLQQPAWSFVCGKEDGESETETITQVDSLQTSHKQPTDNQSMDNLWTAHIHLLDNRSTMIR